MTVDTRPAGFGEWKERRSLLLVFFSPHTASLSAGDPLMRLQCVHCGEAFRVRPEQLGTSGQCPHCGQQIRLPKTERAQVASGPERPAEPSSWLSNSISGLVSLLLHMGLLLLLAVVRYGDFAGAGLGEEVMIGQLPGIELNESQDQQLDATSAPQTSPQSDELESPPEIAPPIATAEAASDGEFALKSEAKRS